jgi:histidinol-phosphatase (PHP family)
VSYSAIDSTPERPIADGHVHTEWSWDADRGDMAATCRQALAIGLPAIAFTDHADFVAVHEGQHELDVDGYLDCVERCRAEFPSLRIVCGIELGEPHLYPEAMAAVLASGRLERVLGSVHCITVDGRPRDLSERGLMTAATAPGLLRGYLAEVLAMTRSAQPFEVLAHLDYPRRYWPHGELALIEADFEEEYRAILREAARRGTVLEVNTTRGADPVRGLCPSPTVIGWWWEEGGASVSFGSDAHQPLGIAKGFAVAAAAVEAAGFRPAADPAAYWRR